VSDDFPGWVEVHLDLADGNVAKFIEKWPMITADDYPPADASYPIYLLMDCEVSATKGGVPTGPGKVYVTLTHVCDLDEESTFLVREQDVLPRD
jgi:hypothetical protein